MKEEAIVIRGGLDESLTDMVKQYRALHPEAFVILSTWADTAEAVLQTVGAYVDDIVLNARPPISGVHNINYQIVCAANGVKRAVELGAERVLLTRTDIALLRPDVLEKMREELHAYDNRAAQRYGMKSRLLISDLYTMATPPYHISDMFIYWHAEDVAKFWSIDSITEACLRPEVTLCRDFAKRVGRPLENNIADFIKLLGELFVIRSAPWFEFFWLRKSQYLSSAYIGNLTFITEDVWRAHCYREADG